MSEKRDRIPFTAESISMDEIPGAGHGYRSRYEEEFAQLAPGQARKLTFESKSDASTAAMTARAWLQRHKVTDIQVMVRQSVVYLIRDEAS